MIANKVAMTQDPDSTVDPIFKMSAYARGILFWCSSAVRGVDLNGLNGVSMSGILYSPNGRIVLKGTTLDSEFIFGVGSSLAGDDVVLQGGSEIGGQLKFTAITLEPDSGPEGADVLVSGVGFKNANWIKIYFGSDTWPVAMVYSSDGTFSETITVPGGTTAGYHEIRAVDEVGNWAAQILHVTEE